MKYKNWLIYFDALIYLHKKQFKAYGRSCLLYL